MRFFKGYVIGFINAVWPLSKDVTYRVIDIPDVRGRKGTIIFGFDRKYSVGLGSVIVIGTKVGKNWKQRIYKIKFNYKAGNYEFELPAFLTSKGIKYKLYKRYDLFDGCMGGGYNIIICKNGEICTFSERCFDYSEYKAYVCFCEKRYSIKINGKKVRDINISSLWPFNDKLIEWFESLLEKSGECDFTYEELGRKLDELGIDKTSKFLEYSFWDTETVTGAKIWREECQKQ